MQEYNISLDERELKFESINDTSILDQEREEDEDLTQLEYELPPNKRCAAPTLNLAASSGVDKCLSSSPLSRGIYRSSFEKCSAQSNKASRSTKATDQVEQVFKQKLIIPTSTYWNSYFDAALRITDNSLTDLNELCRKLEFHCFNEREFAFSKENCWVLKRSGYSSGREQLLLWHLVAYIGDDS